MVGNDALGLSAQCYSGPMFAKNGLLRIGVAAVAGYVAMVIVVIGGTAITWFALGPVGAFQEGSTVASTPWSAISCIFGLFAAMLGGIVAVAVGPPATRTSERVLACVVLVAGLSFAVYLTGQQPSPLPQGMSTADLTYFEAGEVASSPNWYNFSIAVIGAAGVLLGARCYRAWRA